MTDLPVPTPKTTTYRGAISHVEQIQWERLNEITVADAIFKWLDTLENKNTWKTYRSGADQLFQQNFLDPMESLQTFAIRNHAPVLDRIKGIPGWSEATRQARAALYCAFTRFLSRQTEGMIRKAVSSREGTTKTFFKIRETVATRPLKRQQWEKFLRELEKINHRDALIAKTIKAHLREILNAVVLKVSNGPAEVLNSRIKMLKVRSRGFRNKERFANAIYFHLGGLQLYPEGVAQ